MNLHLGNVGLVIERKKTGDGRTKPPKLPVFFA